MNDSGLTTTFREFARLAILFADIAGSTRFYERLGDSKAKKLVDRCLGILSEVVSTNRGTVIKKIGDELMCTFEDPHFAAEASTRMQTALNQAACSGRFGKEHPGIRVGFHFGMVIRDKGDVFGDAVNVAARVVGQAKAHQILTTKETLALLPAELHATTRYIDRFPVKGKQRELEIYEVLWDAADLTLAPEQYSGGFSGSVRLHLRLLDKEVELGPEPGALKLGRGEDNDLVVRDSQSSRHHAKIELRRSRFYVVDQSLNGTYVQINGEAEVFLRHEELLLKGSGVITLGRSSQAAGDVRISFSLDEPTAAPA